MFAGLTRKFNGKQIISRVEVNVALELNSFQV